MVRIRRILLDWPRNIDLEIIWNCDQLASLLWFTPTPTILEQMFWLTLFWSGISYPLVSGSTRPFTSESHACQEILMQSFIINLSYLHCCLIQQLLWWPLPSYVSTVQHEAEDDDFPVFFCSFRLSLLTSHELWSAALGQVHFFQSRFQRQCDWWVHMPIPSMVEQQQKPSIACLSKAQSNQWQYHKKVTWVSMINL